MKRNAFAGTGKVFHFTFRQLLKSKANRRSLLVMLLIALISVPALSLIRGGSNGGGSDTFLIDNQTTLSLSGLAGRLEEEGVGTMQEASADQRDKADLRITDSPDGLIVTQLTGSAYGSVAYAAQITAQFLKEQQLLAAGLSEAAVSVLTSYPDTYIMTDEEYAEFCREQTDDPAGSSISDDPAGPAEEDEGFDQGSYMVQLGLSVLLMMVSILSVSFVIRAVVEEKQSKLVDLLLVSVEPGALLLGKVLASLLYALLYYVVLIGGMLMKGAGFPSVGKLLALLFARIGQAMPLLPPGRNLTSKRELIFPAMTLLFVDWRLFLVCVALGVLVMALTGNRALMAAAAALAMPIFTIIFRGWWLKVFLAAACAAALIYCYWDEIAELFMGKGQKSGSRRPPRGSEPKSGDDEE